MQRTGSGPGWPSATIGANLRKGHQDNVGSIEIDRFPNTRTEIFGRGRRPCYAFAHEFHEC